MSYDPGQRTTVELLADWAAVMRELRRRDVIRTNNNPVGDIAEAIVHAHYGGTRAGFSQAGWDVTTDHGERIQVKAMRLTPTTKRRNVSPIRDRDYDSVVIVVFDEDFQVTEAPQALTRCGRGALRASPVRQWPHHHRHELAAGGSSRRRCRPLGRGARIALLRPVARAVVAAREHEPNNFY